MLGCVFYSHKMFDFPFKGTLDKTTPLVGKTAANARKWNTMGEPKRETNSDLLASEFLMEPFLGRVLLRGGFGG